MQTHTHTHTHAGVEDPSPEYCTQIINKYEPTDEGKAQSMMSSDGEEEGRGREREGGREERKEEKQSLSISSLLYG